MDQERYNELKDQMVWVRFCHVDPEVRVFRDREKTRIEYEPMLVRLKDVIKFIPKEERSYTVPDEELAEQDIDSLCYRRWFTTPGYPTIDRLQKGAIRELKKMGYEIYETNSISYDNAYVKPLGEPEIEVTAPLIEVWFGECRHETKELGEYTGKTFSKEQIDKAHFDTESVYEKLNKREVVSPEVESSTGYSDFDKVAETIGVEEGEIVWQRRLSQRYKGGTWTQVKEGIAKVVRNERNEFELRYPFGFPSFSADQKELKEAIEEIGTAILEHHGRSGFASRNSYTIKPKEKNTEYDIKIIDRLDPAYKDTRYMTEAENIRTIDYCQEDAEKAYEIYSQARKLIKIRRLNRFMDKFKERSLDGTFSIVTEGGDEEKVEVPEERFLECFRKRIANTQDHRQNRTHTEDVGYIDIEKAKSRVINGKIHINIPEEFMGMMIGAKGSNIKQLQSELEKQIGLPIKIILHAKNKEEVQIKLEQIKKAIEQQKSQSHDE